VAVPDEVSLAAAIVLCTADPCRLRFAGVVMNSGLLFVAGLAVLMVAGCGGDDKPSPKTISAARLPGAPAAITDACAHVATSTDFSVRCPTRWPSARGRGAPKARAFERRSDVYLIDVANGFSRPGGHVFHLLLGGQRQPFGRWPAGVDAALRLTTRKVTIPTQGGGTFVQQLPARRIATARVHGARAAVLREPPYPTGGLHGSHVVVLWNEGGHGYLVSVHGERLSRRALVSVGLAIARSTRPGRVSQDTPSASTAPHPRRALREQASGRPKAPGASGGLRRGRSRAWGRSPRRVRR
jgi:hypothetical protein